MKPSNYFLFHFWHSKETQRKQRKQKENKKGITYCGAESMREWKRRKDEEGKNIIFQLHSASSRSPWHILYIIFLAMLLPQSFATAPTPHPSPHHLARNPSESLRVTFCCSVSVYVCVCVWAATSSYSSTKFLWENACQLYLSICICVCVCKRGCSLCVCVSVFAWVPSWNWQHEKVSGLELVAEFLRNK